MQFLSAIFLPWLFFFQVNRPVAGGLCVPMQLSIVGWPFASIWALIGWRRHKREERIWAQVERRYLRVPCGGAPAALAFGEAGPAIPGRLQDISLSGAALAVANASPKSIGRAVSVQLPGAPYAVTARVVRTTPDGLAIEFQPSRQEFDVIRAVIDQFSSDGRRIAA